MELPGQPAEAVVVEDATELSRQASGQKSFPFTLEPLEPLTSSPLPQGEYGKNWQGRAPLLAFGGTPLSFAATTSSAEPGGRASPATNGALDKHVDGDSCGDMAEEEEEAETKKEGVPADAPPGVERLDNGLTPGEDALRRYNEMLVRTLTPKPLPQPTR